MKEVEIWKDIPGYEGYYQVSSFGRVKSLERITKAGRGIHLQREKILVPNFSKSGYYKNTLSINKDKKQTLVHQLMAIAFLGHKIDKFKIVVNHIDGDRLNNHLSNLELVTHRENVTRRYRRDSDRVTSEYPGVWWHKCKRRLVSAIYMDGVQVRLGQFRTEIEASTAYECRLKEYQTETGNG